MGRIKKFLKGLGLIATNPWLLNKVLDDQEVNQRIVAKEYGLDKGLPTVDLLELCPGFNETIVPYTFLDGGSTVVDLGLLKALARQIKNCEYFEIGTWRGESAANLAQVCTQCTTLNIPDEEMRARGWPEDYIRLHRYFSESLRNVRHIQANSLTYDFSQLAGSFDLVFVDGDHHYESVRSDTSGAFRLLRNENAMIVWHDYGSTPADVRWDVLRGILEGTPPDQRKFLYRVSNTLCAIYTRRPLHAFYPAADPEPDKRFIVNVRTE